MPSKLRWKPWRAGLRWHLRDSKWQCRVDDRLWPMAICDTLHRTKRAAVRHCAALNRRKEKPR